MPEKIYPKSGRNMSRRSRVFIAIPVPQELKTQMTIVVESLQNTNRSVMWQNPEKAHITLIFLGHIAQERVQAAAASVKEVASNTQSFQIITGPLDYFYTGDDDQSVVFISIKDASKQLRELFKDLARALAAQDFYPPNRLHPHITLGKLKKGRDRNLQTEELDRLTQDESLSGKIIPVTQINMYETLQERGGEVRYRTLRSYTLEHSA